MISLFLIRFALFLLFAIPASIIDIRTFRIPRFLSFGGIAAMICFYFYLSLSGGSFNYKIFYKPLISAAILFIIYFIARLVTNGELGIGDLIFGIFTGLSCSFPSAIFATAYSAILGLLYYLLCAFKNKKKNGGHLILRPTFAIPYVPFITAGAVLVNVCILAFQRY